MKNILIILLFVTTCSISQTKTETIDWLNSKFGGDQRFIRPSDYQEFVRIMKINYDGSFVITDYEEFKEVSGVIKKSTTKFSGHFKNLSSSSFRVLDVKGYTMLDKKNKYLFLSCLQGNCITQANEYGVKARDEVLVGVIAETMDQSLIERSKKAFIHLIELCGGGKETF